MSFLNQDYYMEFQVMQSFENFNCICTMFISYYQCYFILISMFKSVQKQNFMRVTSDKKQFQAPEPKIISLGKPSARTPLSSVPSNTSGPQNIYPYILPNHLANTVIRSFLPVETLPPVKIVNKYIGRPIQIMIPRDQLSYLEQQIRQLRQKCQQLEIQSKSKELENTFIQISKSTQKIQEHLETVMGKDEAFGQTFNSDNASNDEIDQQQYLQIVKSLQQTSNKITYLEKKNSQLEQSLVDTQSELEKVTNQNIELKKMIEALNLRK